MQFAGHAWFTIADVLVSTIIYICKVSFKVYPETLTPIKKKGKKKKNKGSRSSRLLNPADKTLHKRLVPRFLAKRGTVQVVLFSGCWD